MRPDRLETMTNVLLNKFNNIEEYNKSLNLTQLKDKDENVASVRREGTTAILQIEGVMVPKCSWLDSMCGFVSTIDLNNKFNELIEDNSVDRIINYFDTPGGEVTGILEFAETVFQARNKKEIITYTDTDMCSAGYWVGSASSKLVTTPSSCIGSIGTYLGILKYETTTDPHTGDQYKMHFFQAGDNKLFGSPYTDITEQEKAYLQDIVNLNQDKFNEAVSRYRGVSEQQVIDTQASHYQAADAPSWLYDVLADINYLF